MLCFAMGLCFNSDLGISAAEKRAICIPSRIPINNISPKRVMMATKAGTSIKKLVQPLINDMMTTAIDAARIVKEKTTLNQKNER
mmetsp:Transcript_36820/g.85995  ORF Transcript_36820/g.85995 Transcript_36820/m.85995 type:complete len:85 (-) Transcript_36820:856-1110(-)